MSFIYLPALLFLICQTGFPATMAAMSWVEDIIEKK
jgi:hypothetical protein